MNNENFVASTGARPSVQPDGARSGRVTLTHASRMIKDAVGSFVRSVRATSPREALRRTAGAADQVKQKAGVAADEVRIYLEENTLRDMADDAATLIRRYPRQSLLVGFAIGFLLAWKKGSGSNES